MKQGEKSASVIKQQKKLDDIAQQIAQGKTKDHKAVRNTLRRIETKDVSTYKDLSNKLKPRKKTISVEMDDLLDKQGAGKLFKESDTVVKVGEATTNPARKALDHLEELYTKIDDPEKLSNIRKIMKKFDTD